MDKKAFWKRSIIAILAMFLLCSIAVLAYSKLGYTRYGAVYYYGEPYYSYYPIYYQGYGAYYPTTNYNAPVYAYPYFYNPTNSNYGFRPTYESPQMWRNGVDQICGIVDNTQVGCDFGLICDYTKGNVPGVGFCSRTTATTTYPYQLDTTAPYYYG